MVDKTSHTATMPPGQCTVMPHTARDGGSRFSGLHVAGNIYLDFNLSRLMPLGGRRQSRGMPPGHWLLVGAEAGSGEPETPISLLICHSYAPGESPMDTPISSRATW